VSGSLCDPTRQLFLFHHFIEFLACLLDLFHELSVFTDGSQVVVFVPLFLQFTVLVFKVFDFLLQRSYHQVFFVKFLFEENVVDFVALLHNNKVVVGMGELTDVVLQLHKFLL
jgi:hypothetical protein